MLSSDWSGWHRVQGGEEGPPLPDHAQDDLQHKEAGRPHEVLLLPLRRPQGRGARAANLRGQLHQGQGEFCHCTHVRSITGFVTGAGPAWRQLHRRGQVQAPLQVRGSDRLWSGYAEGSHNGITKL